MNRQTTERLVNAETCQKRCVEHDFFGIAQVSTIFCQDARFFVFSSSTDEGYKLKLKLNEAKTPVGGLKEVFFEQSILD